MRFFCLKSILHCAAAVRFLGGSITHESVGNLWFLSNNPEIANFQTGENPVLLASIWHSERWQPSRAVASRSTPNVCRVPVPGGCLLLDCVPSQHPHTKLRLDRHHPLCLEECRSALAPMVTCSGNTSFNRLSLPAPTAYDKLFCLLLKERMESALLRAPLTVNLDPRGLKRLKRGCDVLDPHLKGG